MIKYPAKIHNDPDGLWIEFIDFPSCATQGDTMEELLANAQEVLSMVLNYRLEENKEIPPPSHPEEENIVYIRPDYKIMIPFVIKQRRKELGLTQSQIAEMLKVPYQTYQKIERCKRTPTISTLEKVAKVLGKELILDIQ